MPGAEGIDLHLVLAGLGSRGIALLVDLILQALTVLLLMMVGGSLGDGGAAVAYVGMFLVLLGYPIVLEAFNDGRTLGKALMGIAVVSADGTPVRFLPAVIRNVVRVVDSLPGVYTVGAIAILATSRNQRLGDLAAGTIVVHRSRSGRRAAVPVPGMPIAAPTTLPPEVAGWDVAMVTADEVAAIREFLTRRNTLAPGPRHQIADALARQVLPKVAGVPAHDGPEPFLERVAYATSTR